LKVLAGLFGQPVESAGVYVRFELAVPFLGVKLGEPGAEGGSLGGRKAPDGCFELFHSAHIRKIGRLGSNNKFTSAAGLGAGVNRRDPAATRQVGRASVVTWAAAAVLETRAAAT
jgi:hypothetical protein